MSADTRAALRDVFTAEGMVPYWPLIRADSAWKERERAENAAEGAYARIAASAFFYSIVGGILNLLHNAK